MRLLPISLCCILLAACNIPAPDDANDEVVVSSSTFITPRAVVWAGPHVQHFSYTDEVLAVVEGAGCSYRAPGVEGDSSLFASSVDAVIRVDGKIEVLKLTKEGKADDSTSKLTYEKAAYRVDVRTQLDSVMEGGVAEHGEMTVEDKTSGGSATVAIVGGCGC